MSVPRPLTWARRGNLIVRVLLQRRLQRQTIVGHLSIAIESGHHDPALAPGFDPHLEFLPGARLGLLAELALSEDAAHSGLGEHQHHVRVPAILRAVQPWSVQAWSQ